MKQSKTGIIFDIKEMSVHDGPGLRATIFFKGCPLQCLWCHNPEGISPKPQLMVNTRSCLDCGLCYIACDHEECQPLGRCAYQCPNGLLRIAGTKISAYDLAKKMHKLAPLLINGGITISGGEPLMQSGFVIELLYELHPLHTIVETCGYAKPEVFQQVAKTCNTIYLDIKHYDDKTHRKLTGVGNQLIFENLRWLTKQKKPFIVRIPMIPGFNDDENNLINIANILNGSKNLIRVELMPFNPYSDAKYKLIGVSFPLSNSVEYKSGLASAKQPEKYFMEQGIPCKVL